MGISQEITTESYGADSKNWLANRKGLDTMESVTLDLSLFLAAHYVDGFIPSGTVLAKVTATGFYGPYDNAAVDGRTVATGHLFDAVRVTRGNGQTLTKSAAAMLWEGIVVEAKLPLFTGTVLGELDANGKTDLKFMKYI